MSQRVRIGQCTGPADAALVRTMLSAHGIDAVVGGEQYANVLGGLGGGFISLDIWVAIDDAVEAAALLRELRSADGAAALDDELAGGDDDEGDPADQPDEPIDSRVERRRRTAVALILAAMLPFGTAHLYARAWVRGLALAGFQVVAIALMFDRHPSLGASLFIAGVLVDMAGAAWLIRTSARWGELPRARVVR